MKATEPRLGEVLFGPDLRAFAHIAEHDEDNGIEVAGFVLWFVNFSTWTGRHGLANGRLDGAPPERRGAAAARLLIAKPSQGLIVVPL